MTAHAPDAPLLAELIAWQARIRPNAGAITFEGRTQTFAQLNANACRVAQGLLADGFSPDARIATLTKNSDAFVELMLGAMKARAAFMPVNWRLAAPEVEYILHHGQVEHLFVEPEFLPMAIALRAALSGPKQIVVVGEGDSAESYAAWRNRRDASEPAIAHAPDDVVMQLYTSGTTGLPKGVQLTNANFAASIAANARAGDQEIKPGYTVFSPSPFFHLNGIVPATRSLHAGARFLIVTQFRPEEAVRTFIKERVTRAGMAPAMIQMCLEVPGVDEMAFPDLKLITYGGSPISETVLARAIEVFKCGFAQSYGMTEACGAVVNMSPAEHLEGGARLRSCGKPLEGVDVRVARPGGAACAPGEVGEVLIRGDMVMHGYWRDADATARTIVDGWLHSGDAGYLDEEGFLYISDRIKEMIVSGAENIYPAEVENALFRDSNIADVAVIGVPDDKWGEAVKALVVLKPGCTASAEEIIQNARAHVAGYKAPKSVEFRTEIPRNASGKIMRRELRAPYWAGATRQVN